MAYNPQNPNGQASSGNSSPVVLASNQIPGVSLTTGSAWSSGSGSGTGTAQNIFINQSPPAILVQLDQSSGLSAGAITFQVTYDGTNWVTPPANTILNPTSASYAQVSIPYTVVASSNQPFIIDTNGWQGLRAYVSTTLSGGTVTPNWALLSYDPVDSAIIYSPTASGFNATVVPGESTGTGIPSVAMPAGFEAVTAELTSTLSNTNMNIPVMDKVGKQIVLPYANPENFVSGLSGAITTATNTVVLAALGAGVKIYVTSFSVANTGATTSLITLTSGSGGTSLWQTIAPNGGGSNVILPTPISTAANAGLYVTTGSASSSMYVSFSGYKGA